MHIPPQYLATRLISDNPWWEFSPHEREPGLPETERLYFPLFRKHMRSLNPGRSCLLTGPRRIGKSILARQFVAFLIANGTDPRKILYFQLKLPVFFDLSLNDCLESALAGGFFEPEAGYYVIFDDIQYRKGWEKELHDLTQQHRGSVFLGISSLAPAPPPKNRRWSFNEFLLPPISFTEYMHFTQNADLFVPPEREIPGVYCPATTSFFAANRHFNNYLRSGGYPEAVFSWEMRRSPHSFARSGILDTVLLNDLPSLYSVGEITEMNRFFRTLALANGIETSQDRLRKDIGLAKNTMRRYLEYLESSFLIYRLRRVDEHNREFLRERHLRLYLANPCLFTALFGAEKDYNPSADNKMDNKMMEQLICSAVLCQFNQGVENGQLRYARWHGGDVDCLLFPGSRRRQSGGRLGTPLWIACLAWTDRPEDCRERLNFIAAYRSLHKYRGPVLFLTRTRSGTLPGPGGMTLELVPAPLFCYGAGVRLLGE